MSGVRMLGGAGEVVVTTTVCPHCGKELAPASAYYTMTEFAAVAGVTVRWLEDHRHEVAGAKRFGRLWKFERAIVDELVADKKPLTICTRRRR